MFSPCLPQVLRISRSLWTELREHLLEIPPLAAKPPVFPWFPLDFWCVPWFSRAFSHPFFSQVTIDGSDQLQF